MMGKLKSPAILNATQHSKDRAQAIASTRTRLARTHEHDDIQEAGNNDTIQAVLVPGCRF